MTEVNLTLAQFERGEIDPETFDHQAHILKAYEILREYDFMEAAQRYAGTIKALTIRVGVPEKFNLTITLAFLSIIAERMAADNTQTSEGFLANNQELLGRDVLQGLYSRDRLMSEDARESFLMPDLVN